MKVILEGEERVVNAIIRENRVRVRRGQVTFSPVDPQPEKAGDDADTKECEEGDTTTAPEEDTKDAPEEDKKEVDETPDTKGKKTSKK